MATPSEITSEPLHLMSFDTQNTWQCCLLEEKLIRSDLFCHENLCAIVPMDFLAFELYDFFYILNSMTKKCLGTEATRHKKFRHRRSSLKLMGGVMITSLSPPIRLIENT